MDVSRPYTAVCHTLDGDVLRVLAGTSLGLTGREVAAMTGRRSHSGVLDVLHRLSEHGLVKRVQLNRGYLFTLNRDHLAAEAVDLLMNLRIKLFQSIQGEIAKWEIDPVHASVYGSTARGDGDTDSDIDLLIVRPAQIALDEQRWQAQVDGLREQIEAWTGNRTSIADVSEPELAKLRRQKRPIIGELGADAITVFGSALTALLEAA
ncbi:MAG TPA: nucleotidyltransferase domain-containing protein [Solirubrobacteraceae bacterium]|nr:nucleotidyltransferase domain-containing protein [Solirubrobacteraceae bacterium]